MEALKKECMGLKIYWTIQSKMTFWNTVQNLCGTQVSCHTYDKMFE